MAAEAGRETRRGAESDEERATDAMGHKIARAYGYATHTYILSRKALSVAPRS